MPFAISATFRFGYYQGHDSSGRVERYPDMVRLQCAFASAAYSLAAYEENGGGEEGFDNELNLPESLAAAIRWFEDNPPDAIKFPEAIMPAEPPKAYRLSGNWKSNGGADLPTSGNSRLKKEKDAAPHVSMDSPMTWWWDDSHAPATKTYETLKGLASEIPYLGEACSPVKIAVSIADEVPTGAHERCANGELTRRGIQNYRVSSRGNAKLLQDTWQTKHSEYMEKTEKKPTPNDEEIPAWTRNRRCTTCYDYRPPAKDGEANLPWSRGLLLEVDSADGKSVWRPEQRQWKDWACAIHRALVKRFTPSRNCILPAFLGGKSDKANNMSIQVLSHDYEDRLAFALPNNSHAILLMFPSSADGVDVSSLRESLKKPLCVYLGKLGKIQLKEYCEVNLEKLWRTSKGGTKRYWQPVPLYVADNRPIQRKGSARPWTVADAMKISLGYVYRDILGMDPHGDGGRLALLDEIDRCGVKVEAGYPLAVSHPRDYVHHMKKDAHFIAGTGFIDLGALGNEHETLALAMGQSRHFSGGFLVPVDIPASS